MELPSDIVYSHKDAVALGEQLGEKLREGGKAVIGSLELIYDLETEMFAIKHSGAQFPKHYHPDAKKLLADAARISGQE